jgi:hypothetical protein
MAHLQRKKLNSFESVGRIYKSGEDDAGCFAGWTDYVEYGQNREVGWGCQSMIAGSIPLPA